ncbi:MAG: tripartite tricarboxylate transporter substrate binding protein [Betaproteobacteria bacterium]|nr:tripartite tricarboxylate transporter substrate binding protein [Betaproteobacteria bacterium]
MKSPGCFASFILLAALALHDGAAFAQSYASKSVRIVVPFPPGGAVDTMARVISPKMTDALNQPVLVDNRPGAGGNLGSDAVAKAAPDGYTILLNTAGLAISHALYRKLPFDAAKDLLPVTQPVATTLILVAGSKLPVASTRELIALAKSKPGSLNYGHAGFGSTLYFGMELLKLSAGVDILAVPYKGDAPISSALMAGEVDVAVMPLQTSLQAVKAGRLRALGVTSARRSADLPDVPTIAEAGVSGYEFVSWYGLFVPAKTPRDVVESIQRATVKVINMPEVRNRIRGMTLEIVGNTPEEFDAKYRADLAKFARIVKEARIPLQD